MVKNEKITSNTIMRFGIISIDKTGIMKVRREIYQEFQGIAKRKNRKAFIRDDNTH